VGSQLAPLGLTRSQGSNVLSPTARPGYPVAVASVCDVCGKGPGFGMSVSYSHRRTRRRFNPNIQTVRALVDRGTRKRLNVCTSCLKAGKVTR
jgi:large subunit ribosomal protein L28